MESRTTTPLTCIGYCKVKKTNPYTPGYEDVYKGGGGELKHYPLFKSCNLLILRRAITAPTALIALSAHCCYKCATKTSDQRRLLLRELGILIDKTDRNLDKVQIWLLDSWKVLNQLPGTGRFAGCGVTGISGDRCFAHYNSTARFPQTSLFPQSER